MPRNARQLGEEAERQFSVGVRVDVPPTAFGDRLNRMHAWLDDYCGANGGERAVGMRSVIDDAIAIFFHETAFAQRVAA